MSSVFGEFERPIYIVNSIYVIITVLGMYMNTLIVIATVNTKSLHNSCNVLIAFCALCDVLHQAGHITRINFIFSGVVFTNSWDCQITQTIPIFGLSAGSFVVLSIGIDRFLAAVFPQYYMHKNNHSHMQLIPILLYAIGQYYLMFAYTIDRSVICIPPEAFHVYAKTLWSLSSCAVYVTAVLVYCAVWVILRKQHNISAMGKIFRSLFIIMVMVVLGWMLTMSGVMVATLVFHLEGMKMYFVHEAVGLFVNSSIALNYLVYYMTSTEYRRAFRYQIRNTTRIFGVETFSSLGEVSRVSGNPSTRNR